MAEQQQEESSSLLDSAYDALDAQQHDQHTTPQPSRRRRPEGGVSTPFGDDDDATEDLEKMSFLPPVTPHAPPPAASPPVPPPPTPPPGGDGGGSPAGRLFHNLQNQVAATQHLLYSGGGRDDAEVNNHVMGGETPSHAVSAPIGTGGASNNHNHAGPGAVAGDEDEASTTSSATSTSGGSGSRRTRRKGAGRSKRNGGQQQQGVGGQPSVTITNYGTSSTTPSGGYQSSVAGTVNTPGKSNVPGAVDVTRLVFRLRILNILLCTATLTVQILGLVQKIFNLTKLVLAGYVMFFALLLCCYEMHIPQFVNFLRDNFGILYTPAGRASFLILLGSTCLTQDFVTFVLGLVLIADGIFTFWVMYRYPEFRRVEEEVGREDATSLLAERVGIAHPPAWATPAGATAGDYGATGSGPSAAKSAGTGGGGEMLYDGTYSITGRVEGGAEAPILDFAQKKKVPWNACWPGKDERGGA